MVEEKKREYADLEKHFLVKQGDIRELDQRYERFADVNLRMRDALNRLRLLVHNTWQKLEEVEEQIEIKNITLVELDEKISRKRKRVEEIDEFVDKVLV